MRKFLTILFLVPVFCFGQLVLRTSPNYVPSAPAAPAWDPNNDGTLIRDYNADLGVSLVSGNVDVWTDQKSSVAATASGSTTRPLFISNALNGHAVLESDNTNDDLLEPSNFGGFSDLTIFIVGQQETGDNAFGAFLICYNADGSNSILAMRSPNAGKISAGFNTTGPSPYGAETTISYDTYYTIRIRLSGGTSYLSINNNTEVTYVGSGINNPLRLALFNDTGNGAPGKKKIARILIYSSVSDQTSIENNLRTLYNHY